MRQALGRARAVTATGARALCSPQGARGVAVEAAWIAAHLALYPLGFMQEKARPTAARYSLDDLPPVQRGLVIGDVEAAGTPILLVHGLVDNRSIFTLLRRGLRRRGFGRVVTINYPVLTSDIRVAARALGEQVEALCAETGFERVHVVGHSMGGLIARYYVQRLGGDARVHTLVSLGSPHAGTRAAQLPPLRICRQLRPTSDVIAELAEPAPGLRTRFVAFWTDLDQLVVPKRSARLEHRDLTVRNVFVRGVGHMSLPIHGRVVHEICTTLAHLDADGSTVSAGVTSMAGRQPASPDHSRGEAHPAAAPALRRTRIPRGSAKA